MSIKNRLTQLEKKIAPKDSGKIWVMIFGDDGRVEYGSDELIGMTEAEVNTFTGCDPKDVIHVTPETVAANGG